MTETRTPDEVVEDARARYLEAVATLHAATAAHKEAETAHKDTWDAYERVREDARAALEESAETAHKDARAALEESAKAAYENAWAAHKEAETVHKDAWAAYEAARKEALAAERRIEKEERRGQLPPAKAGSLSLD